MAMERMRMAALGSVPTFLHSASIIMRPRWGETAHPRQARELAQSCLSTFSFTHAMLEPGPRRCLRVALKVSA